MRFKKPTLLVDEADLTTIGYNDEPNEETFANESILAAANKVLTLTNIKKSRLLKLMNLSSNKLTTNFLLMRAFLQLQTKFLVLIDIKRSQPLP